MAIVKLVCQGCGANLDVSDDVRVSQCGYCGTSNQIKQTVHRPAPAKQQAPIQYAPPPVQLNVPHPAAHGGGGGASKAILIIVLFATFVPLVIGGFVVYMVASTTSSVLERVGFGSGSAGAGLNGRKYNWSIGRPFVADISGDGVDDVIGTVTELGSQQLLLTAMSGSDWSTLWEVDLGRLTDLPSPVLYFEPGNQLVLFGVGATVYAYEGKSGAQRWVASLPDKLEVLAVEGDGLWVGTIDGAAHQLAVGDGKLSPAQAAPSASAKVLRDGGGYELIPELRELDLAYDQFDDLRVQAGFCPAEGLSVVRGRRHDEGDRRCAHPHGLAFVTRDKGTQIPYLLGYARDTKAELWRVQLTRAGSLETVDTGFGQPRAEFVGDDAIVSFVPTNDNNARIRRISLLDGSTKWETTLVRESIENVDGMVVGENLVFVTYGRRIHVLSLDTGEARATLGGF